MIRLVLLNVALVVVANVVTCAAAEPKVVLDQAISEYHRALDSSSRDERLQLFHQAELLFAHLTQGDQDQAPMRNPDLYVNVGNAALQAERLGPAIVAYRRALLLKPSHRRAGQNLDHVRSLLPRTFQPSAENDLLSSFFVWNRLLTRSQRASLAAFLFLATMGLVAISIRWQRTALRNLSILPGIAWLAVAGSLIIEPGKSTENDAVVIASEAIARAADSANSPKRFNDPVPGGTEVRVMEYRDRWCRIRLHDGRDAWIQASALALVNQ